MFALSGTLAKALNLPQETGVLVQRVAKGSPGQRLGLLPGFLPAKIGRHEFLLGGAIILVKALRHGQLRDLSMVVGE